MEIIPRLERSSRRERHLFLRILTSSNFSPICVADYQDFVFGNRKSALDET